MTAPIFDRRRLLAMLALSPAVAAVRGALAQGDPGVEPIPDDPLMVPVRERYAALASYRDTGTVETVYQWPGTNALTENHSFETAFRAPRNFFFRFMGDPVASGDSFVVWCDGGPFQSWWKATGVHEVYDGGRGALAFALGGSPTKDSVNLISPFLFQGAELSGPVSKLANVTELPEEAVDAHSVRLFEAAGRQSGMGMEERPIRVWIDSGTGLIRKVLFGTEAGQAAGLVDQITYQMSPEADPDLADEVFSFTPPA